MGRASRAKRARRLGKERVLRPEFQSLIDKTALLVGSTPGNLPKMSDCLAELIEPYYDAEAPAKVFRTLVGCGAAAWNLSVMSFEDAEREHHELAARLFSDPEVRSVMTYLIYELRARKEVLFPDDNRLIASYDVQDLGDGDYHITVAWTRDNKQPPG